MLIETFYNSTRKMLKVLRKISGHSMDQNDPPKRHVQKTAKNVDKLRAPNSARIPLNPRKKDLPPKPVKYNGIQGPNLGGLPRNQTNTAKENSTVFEKTDSNSGSSDFESHEQLVKQNKINRRRSEEYYIYDFQKYRGPTDDFTTCDTSYDIFEVKDGINPTSARYVVHYLTKAFKDQLTLRFSYDNADVETDIIKLSMEIFKPNLTHYSNSEISHVRKVLRSFFPWEGCSITGRLMTKAIEDNFGDLNNEKHWHRLILTLRELWSSLSCGIIPWKSYTDFCRMEKERQYPKMSFYNILPQCLPTHEYTCCSFEFLEILLAIISKIDLVVDKNTQLDLIFTAGQVCFMNDQHLSSFITDKSRGDPDLITLGKLYYERGNAMLNLFVCYLRSLAEEGKVKDFYLLDNFHIEQYPPHPYKPVTQTALTLTIPSFCGEYDPNDYNTLLKRASKAQSRIYSSNHTFSKIENSFLDRFEEDPYKVYDTIFSKSSKRYLQKFDKNFDPRRLRFLNASEVQDGLTNLDVNDQYAVATWIDHIKDQDFNDFLNVLEDSNYGDGTLAFDYSAFSSELKKNSKKENFSPVRLSKMPISEWFISSWKYETFLGKVRNTLVFKLTKKIGDCDWLIISTDERVGAQCFLTPPGSSDSAKKNQDLRKLSIEVDSFSIKSRPPPPNLLGDKSTSPLMESSSSSIYSGVSRKPFREIATPESVQTNGFPRKTKMDLIAQLPTYSEFMTPVQQSSSGAINTPTQPPKEFIPEAVSKITNPSLLDVTVERNGHPYLACVPSMPKRNESDANGESQTDLDDPKVFVKPLDFGDKVKAVVQDSNFFSKNEECANAVSTEEEDSEDDFVDSTTEPVNESIKLEATLDSGDKTSISTTCDDFNFDVTANTTTDHELSGSTGTGSDEAEKDDGRKLEEASISLPGSSRSSNDSRIFPTDSDQFNRGENTVASTTVSQDESVLPADEIVPTDSSLETSREDNGKNFDEKHGNDDDLSELKSIKTIESPCSDSQQEQNISTRKSLSTEAVHEETETKLETVICEGESESNEESSKEDMDKNEKIPAKEINLTPNGKLVRASTYLQNDESPIDILNDLIDNYNTESLAVTCSEGEILFDVIKNHMEKSGDDQNFPPFETTKPILKQLNMGVLMEELEGKSHGTKDASKIDTYDDMPLETPTIGTGTMVSCFSYNATPPMKQDEFRYPNSLKRSDEKSNVFVPSDDDQDNTDINIESNSVDVDEEGNIGLLEPNGGLKRVMLKTRKSFKNLRAKSIRT